MIKVDEICCPTCTASSPPASRFCEKCGAPLQKEYISGASVVSAAIARRRSRIARKTILNVRLTLGFVAFMALAINHSMHHVFNNSFGSLASDPVFRDAINQQELFFLANYVPVAIYVALAFWAGWNPFAASLIGLILYLSMTLINTLIDPATLFYPAVVPGIAIKVISIVALVIGVKAGLARRRQMANESRNT